MPGWPPCRNCPPCGECTLCAHCCLDSIPNSLDITFGSGWYEPTIDSGKVGCNDPYGDACASQLDGQQFHLTLNDVPNCEYLYTDASFCPDGGICSPLSASFALRAFLFCDYPGTQRCKITVSAKWTIYCVPTGQGATEYLWATPLFAMGGETCAGLSKTATGAVRYNDNDADPEGICVWPSVVGARDLQVEDGG